MAATGASLAQYKTKAEVNRDHYMFKDASESRLAQRYLAWVRESNDPKFEIDITSSFGCVFGIRYGRHWSFYLQESALTQKVQFLKEKDVQAGPGGNGLVQKGTNLVATLDKKVSEPRRFLPGKTQVQTYKVVQNFSLPMRVSEIYPTRTWSREITDKVVSLS